MRRMLFACLLSLPSLTATAQSLQFGVSSPAAAAAGPVLELTLLDMPAGDGTGSLRLAAGHELQLGLRLRQAGSVATIGNLVTTLAADATNGGRYQLATAARGVLGPASLRARLSLSDGGPPLVPLAEGALGPLPVLGSGPPLLVLEAGGSYRLSRALIVDVAPAVVWREGRWGGGTVAELRLLRTFGEDDLSLLTRAFVEPGFGDGYVAAGAGYTLNRRRAPTWTGSLWIGWGTVGLLPGARLAGGERLPDGGRLDVVLAAEPYRVDAWPYRADLELSQTSGPGELRLAVSGGLVPGSGWRVGGRTAYRLPLPR